MNKKTLLFAALAAGFGAAHAQAQTTYYSDDFNRTTLNGGIYNYTTTVTTGDGGASINAAQQLELTNDASAAANASGRVSVATPTSAFSGFNQTLSLNTGVLTWDLNMRFGRTGNTPSGFTGGNYSNAFVLGATGADFASSSTAGYALMFGNTSSPDAFRLASFNSGLTSDILTSGAAGNPFIIGTGAFSTTTQAQANDYYSFQITFNPSNNSWSLYGRDDGATSFSDPKTGTFTLIGTATNSDHTNVALTNLGGLWNYNTAANQATQFDNFSLSSTLVPEPSTMAMMVSGFALLIACRRFVRRV